MIDLSGRLDRGFVDALHAIRDAAEGIGIQFLLVGATARDLLLEKAYGIRIGRATLDVDIAVQVASWEEYEHLSTELQHRAGFERSKSAPHRLQTKSSLLIDFIPFGPISGTRQEVAWPPDGSWVLNVQGFDIAFSQRSGG